MKTIVSQKKLLLAFFVSALTLASAHGAIASPNSSSNYSIVTNESFDDFPLLAIGLISNINEDAGSVQVNGQTILIDPETYIDSSSPNPKDAIGLSIGDHVAVTGDLMAPGMSIATDIIIFDDAYASGDSTAYLRLIIDSVDSLTNKATSGSTTVEIPSNTSSIEDGAEIEVFGSAYGSSFIASSLTLLSAGNFGSGVQRIQGSGVRRIQGSGVRRIQGSGVRRIQGSGVRRIQGSGVRRIQGSGVR